MFAFVVICLFVIEGGYSLIGKIKDQRTPISNPNTDKVTEELFGAYNAGNQPISLEDAGTNKFVASPIERHYNYGDSDKYDVKYVIKISPMSAYLIIGIVLMLTLNICLLCKANYTSNQGRKMDDNKCTDIV